MVAKDWWDQVYIKSNEPTTFRNGQWGKIQRIVIRNNKACFEVLFVDNQFDYWVIYDNPNQYELKGQITL